MRWYLIVAAAIAVAAIALLLDRGGSRDRDERLRTDSPRVAERLGEPGESAGSARVEAEAGRDELEVTRAAADTGAVDLRITLEGEAIAADYIVLPMVHEVERRLDSAEGIGWDMALRIGNAGRTEIGGTARIAVDAHEHLLVVAKAEGSAPGGVFAGASSPRVECDLRAECRLAGVVVGPQGVPVAGAEVRAGRATFWEYLGDGVHLDADRAAGMIFRSQAVTDADGRFELRGLPSARLELVASAPGLTSLDRSDLLPPLPEDIIIALVPALVVGGTLIEESSGIPIEGARVAAFEPLSEVHHRDVASGSTDRDGRFRLEVPRPRDGVLRLRALAQGFDTVLHHQRVPPESGDLQIRLLTRRACTFEGRVRSPSGSAIAGAWVQAHDTLTGDMIVHTRTNASGEYSLSQIAPSRSVELRIRAGGFYPEIRRDFQPCATSSLESVLEPWATLHGRVVPRSGSLVRGTVRLLYEDAAGNRSDLRETEFDPNTGEFAFEGVIADSYVLDVDAEGFAPKRVSPCSVVDGEESPAIEIEVEPGARVTGRVVDRTTGSPIADANVAVADRNVRGEVMGSLGAACVTDESGAFVLENVPASDALLAADHEDYAPASIAVGRAASIEIRLERGASLELRLNDPHGRPVPPLAAYVSLGSQLFHARSSTAPLVLDRLPAGRAKIELMVGLERPDLAGRIFYRTVELLPGQRRQEIFDLRLGGRIHGILEAPADPAVPVTFAIGAARPDGDGDWIASCRPHRDGSFELAGLDAGEWVVTARSLAREHSWSMRRDVHLTPGGSAEVRFTWLPSGWAGRVSTRTGGAVETSSGVLLRGIALSDVAEVERARAYSDATGSFRMFSLPPGLYAGLASLRGYALEEIRFEVPDAQTLVQHDVFLEPEGTLVLRIVDRQDQPVPTARSRVSLGSGCSAALLERRPADEAAVHAYGGAGSKEYLVEVEAPSFFPWIRPVPGRAGSEQELHVELRRLGRAVLQVQNAAGDDAAGLALHATDIETGESVAAWLDAGLCRSSTGSLTLDDHGRLVLDNLPEGGYRVEAPGLMATFDVMPVSETVARFVLLP